MKIKTIILVLITLQISNGLRNFYGEWTLWHSTIANLPDNRVVVHIYPDNRLTMKYRFMRGPMVYHKSKIGVYTIGEMDQEKYKVNVSFQHKEEVFLSMYGIGLQNFNIKTKKEEDNSRFSFLMTMDGTNDIYLQSSHDCFHIVRSVRINEPSLDIPISTFLITQILGTIIGHIINQLLFHTN